MHLPLHCASRRSTLAALVLSAALLIVLVWWGARGIPFQLPEPIESARLPCVSYSPFRHREGRDDITPFNYLVSVSPAQIETDLRILKTLTNCVRTYGLSQGQDAVPQVARKLGMRVRLGVWLSRDEAQNRLQLDRGIQLASEFKDVVDLLVVGNEVLLRREVSPEALGRYLSEAQRRSPVPVTYADVWEFWQRHATLAQHVDVVTVHILPYWEDEPVQVSLAADHVYAVAGKMQQQFVGKPIWVGETGWPAAGRQRAGSVPGKVEQSRFLNDLMARSVVHKQTQPSNPSFNVIEGFDQPWKRSFEGAMGGYWGLFDQFGQARVQIGGSITEEAHWWRGFFCAALAGVAVLLVYRIRRLPMTTDVLLTALSAALLGALVPLQWLMVQQLDRSPREVAVSAFLALLGLAVTGFAVHEKSTKIQDALRLALLFSAATAALVLLLESRYRPFPWWWFLAPTAALWAQRIRLGDRLLRASNEALLMAVVVAVSAILMMWAEGLRNLQALTYGMLLLLLAAVVWPRRTRAISASSAAGAQSSVV